MMEQVRLCAVWPMDNWLGSSLNQIQGWATVQESYSRALEQGTLLHVMHLAKDKSGYTSKSREMEGKILQ